VSKFLIAGLGNVGEEYSFTRHNAGFEIADALASSLVKEDEKKDGRLFSSGKLAFVHHTRYRGKQLVIIKPTTYMNLSGKAINYWLQAEKIPLENLLVVTDDIALPFGTIRMKKKGSDGGHNGLADVAEVLNTNEYARIRFGIGNNFSRGQQVDFVLRRWNEDEQKELEALFGRTVEMIKSFVAVGIERTMNLYN
jgi:peptidyl-tRNA hydrolase, PTH1 family